MQPLWPTNYHTLPPFEKLFQTGTPILTYHKVGPRPGKVRLKGLYVSPERFGLQMDELAASGFSSIGPGEILTPATDWRRVVISFDDGFRNAFENTMEALTRNRFRAIQFLVANSIGKINEWDMRDGEAPEPLMDRFQVRDCIAAGNAIRSHTVSHPRLSRLNLPAAWEQIYASKSR